MTALAFAEPYRRERMLTFLHPFTDRTDQGYQIAQSLIAIGSGGWTGVGLGASRAKWNFLPNAHTDFIFAIIAEELGLLGGLLVLAMFGVFAVLGVRTAARAADRFGALLAIGITVWVVGQAVINVGAVCGLLPITGIPLPVHLLRRHRARDDDVRRRRARQHRAARGAGRGGEPAVSAAARRAVHGRGC